MEGQIFSPTDFVAVLNQTLEFAYPRVVLQGELSNFRVSKNRWVYFDLKDEYSGVKCFTTVYQLPGPLEDGMMLQVSAQPRLHQQFGFSLNVQSILPVGEGSIKKAANLLETQLAKEGIFDAARKRSVPYPPSKIGLIASSESAAYTDFIKIINARWSGLEVHLYDVQVQGERAVTEVVEAIQNFNNHADDIDVLILTRGGGSADDLAVFSTEQVTRAVAASRIPTLVAIGHERDISLAELAADIRASTPSNAAELLVPDKQDVLQWLSDINATLSKLLVETHEAEVSVLQSAQETLQNEVNSILNRESSELQLKKELLLAYNPDQALNRGYALVRKKGIAVKSVTGVSIGDILQITLQDGDVNATVRDKTSSKKEI